MEIYCSKCGTKNQEGSNFCFKCGAQLPYGEIIQKEIPSITPSISNAYYAGFWLRFGAELIDCLIWLIPGFILDSFVNNLMITEIRTWIIARDIVGVTLNWLYESLFLSSSYQATPGKMAMGIIVTDLKGERISFNLASTRFVWKYFFQSIGMICLLFIESPSMPLFGLIFLMVGMFGWLMAGSTQKKQALHDILAGTLVVVKKY